MKNKFITKSQNKAIDEKAIKKKQQHSIDKKYDSIVVLGAGLRADGTPSNMLEDRLNGAIELYKKGIAPKSIEGGEITLHEEHKEFNTYKITHTGSRVEIAF